MTVPDTVTPEAAVRLYLIFLDDPTKLVDATIVNRLQGEVANARDPIDRLKAMGALERAKATDESAYRYDFIKHAKEWADEEGIPASAFREMGVPNDVLIAAGIDGQPKGRRRSRAGTGPSFRRPAVKTDELEAGILRLDQPFTVKDVADRVGGSQMTVKTALDRLSAQGKVTEAGERRGTRGRASKLWRVTSQ
jgi:predicted transcriptional regulator